MKQTLLKTTLVFCVALPTMTVFAAAPSNESAGETKSLGQTLHEKVDQLIGVGSAQFEATAAKHSSDAEFIRRIYLDLWGTVPSVEETRSFLADSTSEKRTKLINRLLEHPRHARRMQYVFDNILMERRGGGNIPVKEWQDYLRESFRANKPWDKLVLEVLSSDGADPATRPAAKFYLDRNFELDVVTRDVGRIFLGIDLECAQCHDHPMVDDYPQSYYYGISAFLQRSYIFRDRKAGNKMSLGEKAEGDAKFTSVFTNESGSTNPKLLDLEAIPDPEWAAKSYIVAPKSGVRSIPSYSRFQQLGWKMTSAENVEFRRNITNRLWALMMGRGLVEPLDFRHADNPPSHPELLDLLADEFGRHNYDIKWMLKELALTKTYQRSSQIPAGQEANGETLAAKYAVGRLKGLTPEQFAWSMMEATGMTARTMSGLEANLIKSDPKFGPGRKEHPLWREEALHDALASGVTQFVTTFAAQGGQKTTFDATADQSLFLLNGSLVQSWLIPSAGSLTQRLSKIEDNPQFAEEIYLSILSRLPSNGEVDEITQYLNTVENRTAASQELAWALLSSAEFRFNH